MLDELPGVIIILIILQCNNINNINNSTVHSRSVSDIFYINLIA